MIRTLFSRQPPATGNPGSYKVLIASEGRRFTPDAVDAAERLVRGTGGHVRILSVARLWGTSFGLPNPGLRPSQRELAEQQDNVSWVIRRLEECNVSADGHIVITRDPCRSIIREAKRHGCEAIVMNADAPRPWIISNFMWSQTPYRVKQRAHVPLYLVTDT